jgi:hypothetical protein
MEIQWQDYKIYLKGVNDPVYGQMSLGAAEELRHRLRLTPRDDAWIPEMVFTFEDGDGDEVVVKVEQVALFCYQPAREKLQSQAPIGFWGKVNG